MPKLNTEGILWPKFTHWGTFNSGETWILRFLTRSLISLSPSDCGHLCSLHLTTF